MSSTSATGNGLDLLNNPPFPLTSTDRSLLAMKDEDFHLIEWQDLRQIIADNSLEDLKRLPSQLDQYLRWSHEAKLAFGSIPNFVVRERLHWTPNHQVTTANPITAMSFGHHSDKPFEDRRDYAVLKNDWPYGLAKDITHLVVWSRTPIAVDGDVGDVTIDSRKLIEAFVQRYFVQPLARTTASSESGDRVLWFKNWVSLQSVRGIDHIHVLVRRASTDQLLNWTSNNLSDY